MNIPVATAHPFKRKKLLTRPVLKFSEGVPRYVRITSEIFLGREMKADAAGADGKKKKEPAHLAEVDDLETGRQAQIIVSAVTLSVLDENYKNHSYRGRCFAITKLAKTEGKQYFPYNVEEIEDPEGEVPPPESRTVVDKHAKK